MDGRQRTAPAAAPADPWHAVVANQPAPLPLDARRLRRAGVVLNEDTGPCDGAHDHCFLDCTWLVRDPSEEGIRQFGVVAAHRRPDGVFATASGALPYRTSRGTVDDIEPGYTAYRTVPAAARLLTEGRMVAVQNAVPASEHEALSPWLMGTIYKVDLAAQTVQLVGSKDRYPLAATRVVVLTYEDGKQVQLGQGLAKDGIQVQASEVFAPAP